MKRSSLVLCLVGAVVAVTLAGSVQAEPQAVRPPAVPLVTHDPYFSIWSCADQLTDNWPRHWTGANHALCSLIRIDGKTYRLMGPDPKSAEAAVQRSLKVLPTRTVYEFEAGGMAISLSFLSPLLPNDLELVSRPVTYLSWTVRSLDQRKHQVALYYDNSAELVVNKNDQPVTWSRPQIAGLSALQMGTQEQPVLEKFGDNLRIDWGYVYVAASDEQKPRMAVASHAVRQQFAASGKLPTEDDTQKPRAAEDNWPVAACVFDLSEVDSQPQARWLMLAYDDLYGIQYLGENLRPWWRRNGMDAPALLQTAAKQYGDVCQRAAQFDTSLVADLERVGGADYAQFCALAYRQAIAAHKLVAATDGQPLMFSKECFSNGCIATVDVMYPAGPIFMLLNNDLLKATVEPIFRYAQSDRWKFDFAPHDVGCYPLANGQVYGGGEKTVENQMPVEECGNLLIMAAVIAQIDGNTEYLKPYLKLLDTWAGYLKQKGLDPENQLCTDDFAGHLAHNANLSIKAIVALGCYAKICEMSGEADKAREYRRLAEGFARKWPEMANDGDHYRLAFDKPGSWSQKYNLVWDKLLGLKLFPAEVAAKEIAYYKTKLEPFGLALDNRKGYTKTDWEVWTATLADSPADFEALMKPVYAFVSQTPQRVPMTDWYWANDAHQEMFQARPVIGGVFIKALSDPQIWAKWSRTK